MRKSAKRKVSQKGVFLDGPDSLFLPAMLSCLISGFGRITALIALLRKHA
jgi:hypothetical protein